MNPIVFALRRPITILVAMLALVAGGVLAWFRMKVDIFPALNLPVIYVCQPYGGMDPAQMEGLIANYYEYHFLYISGIHHVESRNVQGVSLMKLYFHPGTDMAQAMAETITYVNRSRAFMPPGTVPPFVMRFDTGSVPVGYLVLSSKTKSIGQIQDQALFKVRPMFASIPGVSAPPPFGGNQRTIVVRVDPEKLTSKGLSAEDVALAVTRGNTISPSGAIRIQEQMPVVPVNSLVLKPEELLALPVGSKPGVYLGNVATVEDGSDIPTGYALVNGKRAVYILATKRAEASTLDVVNGIRANLPNMQKQLPEDIEVSFEFDQSPYVTGAMQGVATEALIGACLTGLMVLLFLRDWRSVIVVVLNIPLALTGAVVALALSGQTINLMTLGGLALSVGILVDEATVEVENIHTQMDRTHSIALAVRRGNAETAVPRLLAMLCVLAVFIPSFFMQGSARALFVPLSLAVGFAMITSYLLSSTLVPVLSVWLLRGTEQAHTTVQSRVRVNHFAQVVAGVSRLRWLVVPVYLLLAGGLVVLLGPRLGTEIFPKTDVGQFQFRLRAPPGTRIEETEEVTREALNFIAQEVGPENVQITLGYVGVVPPSYPINSVYLWMGGPEEAVMRVSLKRGVVRIEELKTRLREKMTAHLQEWLRARWLKAGVPAERVQRRVKELTLSFEPADVINEVMSFGSPTPIEVAVSSPKMDDNRAFAEKLRAELAKVPAIRDLQIVQSLNYPAINVTVKRPVAAESGATVEEIARAVTPTTSSTRFTVPNYWRDPGSGVSYQVQVEVPQYMMHSLERLKLVPVRQGLLLRDVADVTEGTVVGQYDRYNMRRLVSMTANIEGADLGSVARDIAAALERAGKPPGAVMVDVRGQVTPMREMFRGLAFGLAMAVVVIFLLLTAYFQSFRLALTAVGAVPAVLLGVTLTLLFTNTTLNLQSFMGSIMAIGVAVANAILLVTFADRARREGRNPVEAGIEGARTRVRPILMTSAAMIAGMFPLALGLGESGDQMAPLGRAVIGGLLASTLATLFLLPSLYALLQSRKPLRSVSLDPDDPDSPHHVPPAAQEASHA